MQVEVEVYEGALKLKVVLVEVSCDKEARSFVLRLLRSLLIV